ncbi:MAG TPA: DNA-binding domain-containing protein [Pirellulales bacterium]|nr:DNA-binding domain-containing protein [Pirellulales bacterium]
MADRPEFDLEQIQRWMQAVIVHPLGIAEGIASDGARRHVDVDAASVEMVVTRSKSLSAVERLGIYGYAYYARLLEVLREEFPAVLHAVGDEAFDSFALGYLQKYPSRSYTLFELGAMFPRFLDETRPAAAQSSDGPSSADDEAESAKAAERWMQFVVDLAKFERTVGEVFDGPGPEDGTQLAAAELANLGSEEFLSARLVPVECLRLLALGFPVDAFYKAARRKEDVPPPDPAETFLAVTRVNYTVCHHRLSRSAHALLAALVAGGSLGEAIEQAADSRPEAEQELAANLAGWFTDWATRGYFRAIELAH